MTNETASVRMVDRREAIRRVSALLGGMALVSESALLTGCRSEGQAPPPGAEKFTDADIAYLDEIADTILPETKTPGAKAAKVGAFMALMVTDTYEPTNQQVFRDGMKALDAACQAANHVGFMAATPAQRLALLEQVDRDQKAYMDARAAARASQPRAPGGGRPPAETPPHYFRMMKELTLFGYFTSEIGCTQAMRYTERPGRFDPCVPYTPGETTWAGHA